MSDLKSLKVIVDNLVEQVKTLQENCDISDIQSLKSDISECRASLNAREQYARNWCVRISGLSVPRELVKTYGVDGGCMRHVYNKLVKPTLECSTPNKVEELNLETVAQLDFVPGLFSTLENAHFLGGPTKSRKNKDLLLPPAIICRFKSRYLRNLFLRLKRNHMPTPTDAEVTRGILYYSVTPDLTRSNHNLLTNLKRDARVKAAWSIDGHIRFCLLANDKIKYEVKDVFSPVEDIIASCATAGLKSAENLTSIVKKRGTDGDNMQTPDESGESGEEREISGSPGGTGSRSPGGTGSRSPGRTGSRSPVQAEMRGGQRQPPPIGSRRAGTRAVVDTNKKK